MLVVGVEGAEVSPGGGQVVLQVLATLVTRGGEQRHVTVEPRLEQNKGFMTTCESFKSREALQKCFAAHNWVL